jgi:hypothetical protein
MFMQVPFNSETSLASAAHLGLRLPLQDDRGRFVDTGAMAGSRLWRPEDRTGGPLDAILRSVQARFPDATVSRMVGTHPADDDNVFWVNRTGVEVQIDTGDGGAPPFTVEGDGPGTRLDTDDADAATKRINRLLGAVAEA